QNVGEILRVAELCKCLHEHFGVNKGHSARYSHDECNKDSCDPVDDCIAFHRGFCPSSMQRLGSSKLPDASLQHQRPAMPRSVTAKLYSGSSVDSAGIEIWPFPG